VDTETRKALGLQMQKEKLLEKAQNMTKEQLMNYIANDTTLSKVLR